MANTRRTACRCTMWTLTMIVMAFVPRNIHLAVPVTLITCGVAAGMIAVVRTLESSDRIVFGTSSMTAMLSAYLCGRILMAVTGIQLLQAERQNADDTMSVIHDVLSLENTNVTAGALEGPAARAFARDMTLRACRDSTSIDDRMSVASALLQVMANVQRARYALNDRTVIGYDTIAILLNNGIILPLSLGGVLGYWTLLVVAMLTIFVATILVGSVTRNSIVK